MADALIEDAHEARRLRALDRRKRRRARAIVLVVVLSAAGLALWILPQLGRPLPRSEGGPGLPAPPVAMRDTIVRGDGIVSALMRAGLRRSDAVAVLEASGLRATARRDLPLALYADSASALTREVELQVADDRSVRVMRLNDNAWYAIERREVWQTDTVTVRGPVAGSLVESMRLAGRSLIGFRGRTEMAYALAEAFEYKIDVGRDLAAGDSIVAILERRRTAFGAERVGPLLAGALYVDREWLRAIRFTTVRGTSAYYDVSGRPMRTTFLTAPVEFRRMSSAFGLRAHPLLGTLRRHAGIDFAAPFGTPVRAVGDGAVIKAGYAGGFGKLVEIRHRDGLLTRYGHLRGFAPSMREGQVVTQGQVIGFVGSTGLSTGPHLHFETLVNGVSREPTRTLREASGVTLDGPALSAFAVTRNAVASRLGLGPPTAAAASPGLQPVTAVPGAPVRSALPGTSVSAPK